MRRGVIGTCLLLFTGGLTLSITASEDMVIHGGTIYTADKTRPLAEALVVRDEKLIYVDGQSVSSKSDDQF